MADTQATAAPAAVLHHYFIVQLFGTDRVSTKPQIVARVTASPHSEVVYIFTMEGCGFLYKITGDAENPLQEYVGKKVEGKEEVEVCVTKLPEGWEYEPLTLDDFSDHESDENSDIE